MKMVEKIKISEKLSEIKQKEGQLMRLYGLRESVIEREFKDAILSATDIKTEEVEKREKKFLEDKKQKVLDMNKEIDDLKAQLIEMKNKVNKRNFEEGLDKKLIQMKYIRLELSKLMNLVKNDRSMFSRSMAINVDVYEELGISERIKDLEGKKARLDAEIQKINWSADY